MTDAELAEIGHAADQKLADEDATAAEKVCTCGALDYQGCFRGLTVGQFLKSPSKLQHLKRV